jgi:hypothetical protein
MHPMVILGDKAQVEARLSPLGYNVNVTTRCKVCAKRTTGSEIILYANDGIAR